MMNLEQPIASPLYFNDYRSYLKARFVAIRTRRPEFSQGAFARLVGLSPNRFSELLRGKQGLSSKSAIQIAERLNLTVEESEAFCDLVAALDARSRLERDAATERLSKKRCKTEHHEISPEIFLSICNWYFFAILEMLQSEPESVKSISTRLDLPEARVSEAMQTLRRLGFASFKDGRWWATHRPMEVKGGLPSTAIKRFHQQILERARMALDTVTADQREYTSMFLRASPHQLPMIREKIREFWTELEKEVEKEQRRTRLYALATQYFPVER